MARFPHQDHSEAVWEIRGRRRMDVVKVCLFCGRTIRCKSEANADLYAHKNTDGELCEGSATRPPPWRVPVTQSGVSVAVDIPF